MGSDANIDIDEKIGQVEMGYILHIAASSMARRPALRLRGHDFCERPVPHSMPPALLAPVVPEAVTSAPLAVRVAVCWPQKPNAPKWTAEPNPSPLHRLTATLTVYGMGNMFPRDSFVLPQTRYTSTSRISRTIVSSTGYLRTSVALISHLKERRQSLNVSRQVMVNDRRFWPF